jgi:hypothetical protein
MDIEYIKLVLLTHDGLGIKAKERALNELLTRITELEREIEAIAEDAAGESL